MVKTNFLICAFLIASRFVLGQLLFNEVMSDNDAVWIGNDALHADWIELYNTSPTDINLQGYFLSDDPHDLYKWTFPSAIIPAYQFLLIKASGMQNDSLVLHCNFKIASDGETLYLTAADSSLVDSIYIPPLQTNQSFGRWPDASSYWCYLDTASPSGSNNIASATLQAPVFSVDAGFYSDSFRLFISNVGPVDTVLFSIDGSEPSIQHLTPFYYTTKEDYSSTDTTLMSYRSFLYTNNGILVTDRSTDTNKLALIRPSPAWWSPPTSSIFKGTVVKARAYKTGYTTSTTTTASYFVDTAAAAAYSLPVISVSTTETNLFDYYSGIHVPGKLYYDNAPFGGYWPKITANYTQRGRAWERPAYIEYFQSDGQRKLAQSVGVRIAGNVSRGWARKSLRVYARKEYDSNNRLDFPFFSKLYKRGNPTQSLESFKRITIRNSGTYWNEQLFKDAFSQLSIAHIGLDVQHSSPSVVFINGEYWGVMNIRQRYDCRYLEDHYNISDTAAVILAGSNGSVNYGMLSDSLHYVTMRSFIKNQDMSIPSLYDSVHQLMDVDNFAALFMAQIYMNNSDWLSNNRKCWRMRTSQYDASASYGRDGRYRWFVFDLDHAFKNPHQDRLDITLNTAGGSTIFENLLDNPNFRNYWINLMADHMNSTFLPARIAVLLDSLYLLYDPEIAEHRLRWSGLWTNNSTQSMQDFALVRPYYMRQFIINQFADPIDTAIVTLNVQHGTGGYIQINTLKIDEYTKGVQGAAYPWSGVYFKGVPVHLMAIPKEGYRFVEWQGTGIQSDTLVVNFVSDTLLTAVFEPVDSIHHLHINELIAKNESLNYDYFGEYDDWIELYNADSSAVALTGLYLTNSMQQPTKFKLSGNGPVLASQQRIILWADADVEQGWNHLDFKLSAEGDTLALFQLVGPDTVLLDSVIFESLDTDISYSRMPEGVGPWYCTTTASPQQLNNIQAPNSISGLYINECMASNNCYLQDEYGEYDDWIELYNATADTVCLKGLYLSDDDDDPFKHAIQDSIVIFPDSFVVFWADDQTQQGPMHLNFKLSAAGEQIALIQQRCATTYFVDSFTFGQQYQDISYGRSSDAASSLQYFDFPTAMQSNIEPDFSAVFINEFMADNDLAVQDEFGEHDDWIELYNAGTQSVDIGGLYLSDAYTNWSKCEIPRGMSDSTTIPAGGFLVFWADDQKSQGGRHLNFKLSAAGEQIGLARIAPWDTSSVSVIDSIAYSLQWPDVSYGRIPDGGSVWSAMSYTPAASNVLVFNQTTEQDVFNCQLYPNPTADGFWVRGVTNAHIKVWTLQGQSCVFRTAGAFVDTKDLSSGMYIVEVEHQQQKIYKKLILK